jgi:excinuclease ABC subunit A
LGANPAAVRVASEARAAISRIVEIGLGYLTLARRIRSLSGGEAQRLKLAGILAETLRGVLYVLDEPSQGLHPTEIDRLLAALRRLTASGNTVLVVDHDELLMRHADWIIDLGPGGGARGGRLMAKFRPSEAARFAAQSATARHLSDKSLVTGGRLRRAGAAAGDAIKIEGARRNNLALAAVHFPRGAMTVVTGVSGAGKSSLVLQTLYVNAQAAAQAAGRGHRQAKKSGAPAKAQWRHADKISGLDGLTTVALVDRRPVAKSSVSMPATYLDVFGEIRDLFAAQPDAQVMGLTARSFSLSADAGRCPECKGRGELSLTMRFLADARVRCPVCKGARYIGNTLAVRYLGLTISEVLELTLDEVVERFKNHRKIMQRLEPAVALGLGYLKLGQPSASLSGGEAQRLKLVPHLARLRGKAGGETLLILDEPTTGLHFEDVQRLLTVLGELVQAGTTVVAIEHNADVIKAADWRIDLGPGSAAAGGKLMAEGPVA